MENSIRTRYNTDEFISLKQPAARQKERLICQTSNNKLRKIVAEQLGVSEAEVKNESSSKTTWVQILWTP